MIYFALIAIGFWFGFVCCAVITNSMLDELDDRVGEIAWFALGKDVTGLKNKDGYDRE